MSDPHVDPPALDGQLFDAARNGDVAALAALPDTHPEKLHVRTKPHEQTLLHLAAFAGHVASVDLLLRRGLDVNARDDVLKGDNTYAMHWAAASAHLDVVRRLADAGGDARRFYCRNDIAYDIITLWPLGSYWTPAFWWRRFAATAGHRECCWWPR